MTDVSKVVRKHSNNKGYRQIKNDGPYKSLRRIARKLKLPYKTKS